jgi:hypothetical protein
VTARPEHSARRCASLIEDTSGRIWIGSAPGGLACMDGDELCVLGNGRGLSWGAGVGFGPWTDNGRLLAGTSRGILCKSALHSMGRQRSAAFFGSYFRYWVTGRSCGSVPPEVWLAMEGREIRVYDGRHDLGFDWVWCLLRDRHTIRFGQGMSRRRSGPNPSGTGDGTADCRTGAFTEMESGH